MSNKNTEPTIKTRQILIADMVATSYVQKGVEHKFHDTKIPDIIYNPTRSMKLMISFIKIN